MIESRRAREPATSPRVRRAQSLVERRTMSLKCPRTCTTMRTNHTMKLTWWS